jgi:hypothetical protein
MALTINWDQVTALTRNKHLKMIRDQFFTMSALLTRMEGRVRRDFTGPLIVCPLSFMPEGGGGEWYAGLDKADIRARNPITASNYYARNLRLALTITGDEELQVSGPEAVYNLATAKKDIAEKSIKNTLGGDLYNAATNPKAIAGLQYAIPETIQSVSQTYGGITCGGSAPASDTFGWWQPFADNTAYNAGAGNTFMHAVENPVQKAWNSLSNRSSQEPNLIISPWGAWGDFHNSMAKNERYDRPQQQTDLAKAGFTNLMYRSAPWVADSKAPRSSAGVEKVYLLNTSTIYLYVHPERDFSMPDGWVRPIDQDARVAITYWRGELCFSERRNQGVIGNVTIPSSIL